MYSYIFTVVINTAFLLAFKNVSISCISLYLKYLFYFIY